jgi:hypothetical protein
MTKKANIVKLESVEVSTPTLPAQNRFAKGSGCFTCKSCGKFTRQSSDPDAASIGLCHRCYEMRLPENAVNDGRMTEEAFYAEFGQHTAGYVAPVSEAKAPKAKKTPKAPKVAKDVDTTPKLTLRIRQIVIEQASAGLAPSMKAVAEALLPEFGILNDSTLKTVFNHAVAMIRAIDSLGLHIELPAAPELTAGEQEWLDGHEDGEAIAA